MHQEAPAATPARAPDPTAVLILRELYEIKTLMITHLGKDRYKPVELEKVVQYIEHSARQMS